MTTLHPIFLLLKQKAYNKCIDLITVTPVEELLTIKNKGGVLLADVVVDMWNVPMLEKLIDVCGGVIFSHLDAHKRFYGKFNGLEKGLKTKFLKKSLQYDDYKFTFRLYRYSDNDEGLVMLKHIIKMAKKHDDCHFITGLYRSYHKDDEESFFYKKIIKMAKKHDKNYNNYTETLLSYTKYDTSSNNTSDYDRAIEVLDTCKDNTAPYNWCIINAITCFLFPEEMGCVSRISQRKTHQTLPGNIDLVLSIFKPTVTVCKELHSSCMVHDKLLFDYFYSHEYHLTEYSVNLMDCVVSYEFQLASYSGFCEVSEFDLFDDVFVDVDIFYCNFNDIFTRLLSDHPTATKLLDDMIFRDDSLYYILKLLQSSMPKTFNQFTKRMLSKFIVPFRVPNCSELTMLSIHYKNIIIPSNNTKLEDIKYLFRKHYCMCCNKIYFRDNTDMLTSVSVYTMNVKAATDDDNDGISYTDLRTVTVDGVSFCSLECQEKYQL